MKAGREHTSKTSSASRSTVVLIAVSNRRWIENDHWQPAKIRRIERQYPCDSVGLHRSHQSDVMRPEARHRVLLNQYLPQVKEIVAVRKQRKSSPKEPQPLPSLNSRHP
jgi:hypothetical protein